MVVQVAQVLRLQLQVHQLLMQVAAVVLVLPLLVQQAQVVQVAVVMDLVHQQHWHKMELQIEAQAVAAVERQMPMN
jgi:uncharacterized membrane protein (UPF0182 family)